MDTTNTTQHVHEQHNAHHHVIPNEKELGFKITHLHYKNKKKTQELKIRIGLAKKYFPECRSPLARDGTKRKRDVWSVKLIFENERGQVWPVDYKYWENTGYVLHGEDWNAHRDEVNLEAGDVLWFRKDQRQENKYFVTIQKRPPTEQDGGRAATSIPRITTGHHETHELVRGENHVPLGVTSAQTTEVHHGSTPNRISTPLASYGLQNTLVSRNEDVAVNGFGQPQTSYGHENNFDTGTFSSTILPTDHSFGFYSTAPAQDQYDGYLNQDSGDKGKRPLENGEKEAPRNIRPNHGIFSETNRSSLAKTEVKEYLASILEWPWKAVLKDHEERIQKLEAREEKLMSIISSLQAQVQASQKSSDVLLSELNLFPS